MRDVLAHEANTTDSAIVAERLPFLIADVIEAIDYIEGRNPT